MMIAADNLCSVGTRLSEYARKLPQNNPNVRKRYIEKIKIIKFNDPYTLQLSSDMPTTVTTGHVVDYLINFKSPYTGESVKNLRSLDAYRKFEAGFVQSMKGRLMENFYIVVGKVSYELNNYREVQEITQHKHFQQRVALGSHLSEVSQIYHIPHYISFSVIPPFHISYFLGCSFNAAQREAVESLGHCPERRNDHFSSLRLCCWHQ